ncbi:uncharacterized protein MONBRDRAFT_26828 [Monosiga brevicollis MX1]|uniref:Diphosphomevalonate decarboxylase n=1 Tax=Monosiga brevicollis TaxID=81824 RepID=A9V3M8_MONBE|nr:uncharacterized protein MONBRDRAFT_26828 [Monosiga brevicollis MX1]EDQ87730.1 predicted protein [Monosiga brevicollis MX1]|eukprot:XP_001747263.1 hypothetical protein [Monosiga brevicollis MX1]
MAQPEEKRVKLAVARHTATAPVNIAVIKYWGKRDTKLLLPINDSLSGTLSQDEMHARTTVAASESYAEDTLWLNNEQTDISNPRVQNVIRAMRAKAKAAHPDSTLPEQKLLICSVNNFPTAAGLASSAAGYAALVAALAGLYDLPVESLTDVARIGSGSACRSLSGGFVRWRRGELADGTDSLASQVVPESHWPEMEVLILVLLTKFNAQSSSPRAAYTYDAGPNCVIYALKKDIPDIIALVARCFPSSTPATYVQGRTTSVPEAEIAPELQSFPVAEPDQIKYIIHTGIGDGPRVSQEHLINEAGERIASA